MKRNKKQKSDFRLMPSVQPAVMSEETTEELLNKYGTYNIQPTADTENQYPKIAQSEYDFKKH